MSIVSINIKNYKSLQDIQIKFDEKSDLFCFLGKNSTGKSNLLNALKYFYDNMFSHYGNSDVIDNQNVYVQGMEISIVFDFSNLLRKVNTSDYLYSELKALKPHFNDKNQMLVTMTQNKEGRIRWYPKEKDILKNIYSMFPLYPIHTRSIDLTNWDMLWEIISDLSKKPSNIPENEFCEMLDKIFIDAYGDKYGKGLKIIKNALEAENIDLYKHNYIDRYKNILAVRFGGREFLSEGNKLEYYSDGLNSFRYIKILLRIISKLTTTSWKEPWLLIDEPEIGLHSSFIYELAETIKDNVNKDINLFITTHSPDLICELMKNDVKAGIYRTDSVNNYTTIDKMGEITDEKDLHRLTINEARTYFANAIVMLEGVSDIEVFSHRSIRKIFPKIKQIEFYSMNSNNVAFKLISPNERKFKIPYLLIVDMDKIIQPKVDDYKNPIKYGINNDQEMNPLSNKEINKNERYLFYSRKKDQCRKNTTHDLNVFIKKMLKEKKFAIKNPGFYIDDPLFQNLIEGIKEYCLQYYTYPFATTIEGALINSYNINDAISWIKQDMTTNVDKLDELLNKDKEYIEEEDRKYRATVLRLICKGKYNSLHNLGKLKIEGFKEVASISNIEKKTSGWIDEWLRYYFRKNIDRIDKLEDKRKKFSEDFPELFFVLTRIEDLI